MPTKGKRKENKVLFRNIFTVPSSVVMLQSMSEGELFVSEDNIEKVVMLRMVEPEAHDFEKEKEDGDIRYRELLRSDLEEMEKEEWVFSTDSEDGGKLWSITEKGVANLVSFFLKDVVVPKQASLDVNKDAKRVSEPQAAVVFLSRLAAHQNTPGKETPCATASIMSEVKRLLPLSQEDLAPLEGRKDKKIDQIIRNVVSHRVLDTPGYVKRVFRGGQTKFVITPAGRAHLAKHFSEQALTSSVIKVISRHQLDEVRGNCLQRSLFRKTREAWKKYVLQHPEEAPFVAAYQKEMERQKNNGSLNEWTEKCSLSALDVYTFKEAVEKLGLKVETGQITNTPSRRKCAAPR